MKASKIHSSSFTWISDQSESGERARELGDLGADVLVVEHVAHQEDVVVAVDRGLRPEMDITEMEIALISEHHSS